ncbi:HD domain-containing protein [Bacillus sp. REN3]|uniref:HD domain-containing protein n=1 Tax=Bacillus sp. REN3 TaxID=2802440 RepID=UPI001AED6D24|nr:HD domain-containing protein [Bacillus sp. REN3]
MLVSDCLYGDFIVEKVLEELILSKPVQRLKGIHQAGASYLVNEKWNVTRYCHSIGVMLLIRRLGGSLEEQIAALLHDVSHTAFSHVVDFVFENDHEDYHESIYHFVIKNSEIPSILAKHDYHYEDLLLDVSKWNLLEQPAPDLCADRVDYTLRDMYEYGYISLEEASHFLGQLIVGNGKICLNNIAIAEWFVETYYKEVIDFFMHPLNIYANVTLARLLKKSIESKVIDEIDFLGTDQTIIQKIKASGDTELLSLLAGLNHGIQVKEDSESYDLHKRNKIRLLDPSVLYNNEFVPASFLSEKVRHLGNAAYDKAVKGMFVKVISG